MVAGTCQKKSRMCQLRQERGRFLASKQIQVSFAHVFQEVNVFSIFIILKDTDHGSDEMYFTLTI